jgi:hypothetical protein
VDVNVSACADEKELLPGGTHSDEDSDPDAPSFRWAILNPVRVRDDVGDMGPWKASTRFEDAAAAAKNPASAIRSFIVRLLLGVLIGIGDC